MTIPPHPNHSNPETSLSEIVGEPIHAYSRAQALEDGVLVDVSAMAREAGFIRATALTQNLWQGNKLALTISSAVDVL